MENGLELQEALEYKVEREAKTAVLTALTGKLL